MSDTTNSIVEDKDGYEERLHKLSPYLMKKPHGGLYMSSINKERTLYTDIFYDGYTVEYNSVTKEEKELPPMDPEEIKRISEESVKEFEEIKRQAQMKEMLCKRII